MTLRELDCDVLIVGGGLVGSALANALCQLELDVVLVESYDPSILEQPSFDSRVSALANGTQRILDGLGLWSALRTEAEPILDIHISERGKFGAARISAREENVDALGYTIENRVIGEVLWRALAESPGFRCFAPARFSDFVVEGDCVSGLIDGPEAVSRVSARLLLAADGMRSGVRAALGIDAVEDDYDQVAVIFNFQAAEPLPGRAFERFTPEGPLAILPLSRGRGAVVWTLSPEHAERVLAFEDDELVEALTEALGNRLGTVERVGERAPHPLRRVRSRTLIDERVVLIGNAALSVHPVAGQGFNLALRDVATLVDLIADELLEKGEDADIGGRDLLDKYVRWRRRDQRTVAAFTHGLVRLFGLKLPGLGALRGAGLMAFDLVPGAKAMLARQTMGRAGRLPRLARGLPLR